MSGSGRALPPAAGRVSDATAGFAAELIDRSGTAPVIEAALVATFAGCDRSCLPLWTALERSSGAECLRKLTAPEGQDPRRTDGRWAISRGESLAAASQQGAVKTGEHRPRRSDGCGRRHEQARSELPSKTTLAHATGRPRPLPARAVLTALLCLALDDRPLFLTEATRLLFCELSRASRGLLGVPGTVSWLGRFHLAPP